MHGFFMFVAVSCRDKSPPVLLRIKHFSYKERLKSKSFFSSLTFKKMIHDLWKYDVNKCLKNKATYHICHPRKQHSWFLATLFDTCKKRNRLVRKSHVSVNEMHATPINIYLAISAIQMIEVIWSEEDLKEKVGEENNKHQRIDW